MSTEEFYMRLGASRQRCRTWEDVIIGVFMLACYILAGTVERL